MKSLLALSTQVSLSQGISVFRQWVKIYSIWKRNLVMFTRVQKSGLRRFHGEKGQGWQAASQETPLLHIALRTAGQRNPCQDVMSRTGHHGSGQLCWRGRG